MGELCRSADLMQDAKKRGYCIPAYNVFNYESVDAVFSAAEKAKTPIIMMAYLGLGMPLDLFAEVVKTMGKKAKVPFSVHLDHSPSYEICLQAIQAGFTSVMIDGSKLPFDENAAVTKKVVEAGRAASVDVEGELGMVGREEAIDRTRFTQPDEAAKFVELTGVDTLAIAIGNSHGVYFEEPKLDIPLLADINKAVSVPLVLHGSSMIPVDQLGMASQNGIAKVNIATEYFIYYREVVEQLLGGEKPPKTIVDLMAKSSAPVIDFIAKKMLALNPNNISII